VIYYTQLLFINEGKAGALRQFEDATLPILKRHCGKLLCRIPMDRNDPVSNPSCADEIHLLSFAEKENFTAYMKDPERQNILHIKKDAVERVLLIEGMELNP
jgi:uncharacterized protein (DUF1330 family)